MKKYFIVAESGADLSPSLIEKYDIRIASMHVALGGVDYLDGGSILIDEICNHYNKTGEIPKTSAVAPYQYQQIFKEIKAENPDAVIIHIGYSSQLTSSFQNAMVASKGFNQIYHIDSCNVSIGQAYIVMKAANLIEKKPDISTEKLLALIEKYASKTRFCFIPGDLKYLRAGGRVSNAQSLIASILHIKPLLELIDGKMLATKKYMGSQKSIILKMITDFFTKCKIDIDTIFLGYTHEIDDRLKVSMEKLAKEFGAKNCLWFKAGAVITSHSGPGGIGIVGLAN